MSKNKYPRECVNHPDRSDVVYVYTGPYNIGGLYCKECRINEDYQEEGEVSGLRAEQIRQQAST